MEPVFNKSPQVHGDTGERGSTGAVDALKDKLTALFEVRKELVLLAVRVEWMGKSAYLR